MPDKYQKEIEEILNQVGTSPSKSDSSAQKIRADDKPVKQFLRNVPALSAGQLLFAGVILFLVGVLSPIAGPWDKVIAWVGVASFVMAYLRYFSGSSGKVERRWRGELIEYDEPPTQIQRFWRWLNKR